ncbi:MAG: hypothetical protein ABI867_05945 [Kofleriaceae bacterium]
MLIVVMLVALVTPTGEAARIQTHLATVDHELRIADTSGLSSDQRARRAMLIAELARYRDRGVFPRNLQFDRPTPYFIDDRGVRCAMAHLIETHGGAALVARVAATANTAYIRDLAGDAELRGWLDANGLTTAEAARIQPSYPRAPGERCDAHRLCTTGICEPSLDQPGLAYCSIPCDASTGGCPIGIDGIAMECRARGDRDLCVYPEPTPGALGWPCDANTASVCVFTCLPEDQGSTCTTACSNSQACPRAARERHRG